MFNMPKASPYLNTILTPPLYFCDLFNWHKVILFFFGQT